MGRIISTRHAGPDDPIYSGGYMISTHRSTRRSSGGAPNSHPHRKNPPQWIQDHPEYNRLTETQKDALAEMGGFNAPSLHLDNNSASEEEEIARLRELLWRHFQSQVAKLTEGGL